jgi:hypothetical protein
MDQVLAILTPELMTLLAYIVGAGLIGVLVIAGVIFLIDMFGNMIP